MNHFTNGRRSERDESLRTRNFLLKKKVRGGERYQQGTSLRNGKGGRLLLPWGLGREKIRTKGQEKFGMPHPGEGGCQFIGEAEKTYLQSLD